jgi:hypothetical protein
VTARELKVRPLLGSTSSEAVSIDCDNMRFRVVKRWAFIVLEKCRLGGFIILKSSEKHYHVVFDSRVSWEDNLSALGWFSVLSHNPRMKDFLVMQCIKKGSTLRVVGVGDKPAPRVVYRYGEQTHEVEKFLKHRKIIKRMLRLITLTLPSLAKEDSVVWI